MNEIEFIERIGIANYNRLIRTVQRCLRQEINPDDFTQQIFDDNPKLPGKVDPVDVDNRVSAMLRELKPPKSRLRSTQGTGKRLG